MNEFERVLKRSYKELEEMEQASSTSTSGTTTENISKRAGYVNPRALKRRRVRKFKKCWEDDEKHDKVQYKYRYKN